MKRTVPTRAMGQRILFVLVLNLLFSSIASAILVGNPQKVDPILASLVSALDKQGIDVVGGDARSVDIALRPRVAMLSGMESAGHIDPAQYPWLQEFERGAIGFVAGAKLDPPLVAPRNSDTFLSVWRSQPREKRVFISFTAADREAAHAVAKVLEEQGYVTFTYINADRSAPHYSTQLAGEIFSQAGHHIVVDTRDARRSPGVWLERSLFARHFPYQGPPDPQGGAPGRNPEVGPGGQIFDASFDVKRFIEGVQHKWIVTENPSVPGKLFIHESSSGGVLNDLLYYVQVDSTGMWTVHDARQSGESSLGKRVAQMARPKNVSIGPCTCL